MFGTVTDSQGALIPGATVTLISASTQQVRTTKTSDSGGYLFSLLPVGAYSISVEQTGFKRYERKGIVVQANENVNVGVSLEVGDVQSTVVVDAQASQVETRSATLKETVDSRRVVELPLNGRNAADLSLLATGVVSGVTNNTGIPALPIRTTRAGKSSSPWTARGTTISATRSTAASTWTAFAILICPSHFPTRCRSSVSRPVI